MVGGSAVEQVEFAAVEPSVEKVRRAVGVPARVGGRDQFAEYAAGEPAAGSSKTPATDAGVISVGRTISPVPDGGQ